MKTIKPMKMHQDRRTERIFYIAIISVPLINWIFLVFFQRYLYTFLFSVQKFDFDSAKYVFQPDIFMNFRNFFNEVFTQPAWAIAIKNSFMLYGLGWLLTPISIFIPYYMYKKFPGYKVFKFILMIPGMISGMVWVLIYKLFMERGLPIILDLPFGPLSNKSTQMLSLIIYSNWLGIAGSMLLYTGVLSGVSESVVDAGKIDGLGKLGEIWHVCLPTLYPVWMVGVISGVVGIFSGSPGTFEFFGYGAGSHVSTTGFLLFVRVMAGDGFQDMCFNAAGSIVFTFVVLPITLTVKWLLERYGPSEDSRQPIRWFWQRKKRVG